MKIGIVGYGNLGKAVERLAIKDNRFEIVGIFSRRKVKALSPVYSMEEASNFKGIIDVMIMCGGSEKDLMTQTPFFAKNFNVIDTFDTHKNTVKHFQNVDKVCKQSQTSAIVCCGWDPGIFSCLRVLFSSVFQSVNCFYGKGISMGHTNAIKRISGVLDAKQYTIPNKKALSFAKKGKPIDFAKHNRLCYVVTNKNKKSITKKIKDIPNYFKNEPTFVKFVSQKTLDKKHNSFAHQGQIIATSKIENENFSLDMKMKTSSNPLFTAKIILAYSISLNQIVNAKAHRAFTPIQIPLSWLINKDNISIMKEFC